MSTTLGAPDLPLEVADSPATRTYFPCPDKPGTLRILSVVHAHAPSSLRITGVIFETHGRSVVFACEPSHVCLKLIRSKRIFNTERLAYEQLKGEALDLFLPLLFFCRTSCPVYISGRPWRGYCMRRGQHTLRDILYRSPRHSEEDHAQIIRCLLQDRDRYVLGANRGPGGQSILFKPTQTVQLSLCLAALRLLHALHAAGWVHGDSHLGNFVYAEGRLYAIDFERSFPCTDHVQHLLDIQELFGHLSSILVHTERPHEWDMKDIAGIYFHRHPLFEPTQRVGLPSPLQRRLGLPARRQALYMLPSCTCFTCPKQPLRLKGCSMCGSELNRASALRFAQHTDTILADMEAWGLCRMRVSLLQTRKECIQRCMYVANIIFPCISDGLALAPPTTDEKEVLHLPVKELAASRTSCCIALRRLLYAPCLSSHSLALARLLCHRLHMAGHTEAARILWLYVAWHGTCQQQQPPPVCAVLPAKRTQCCLSSSS